MAAKTSGVKRFIFASSIHAISGYPKDMQVKTIDPVNPGDLYGRKSFAEIEFDHLVFFRCNEMFW
jgi:nucleoside-diphosphate-sugar epimerase